MTSGPNPPGDAERDKLEREAAHLAVRIAHGTVSDSEIDTWQSSQPRARGALLRAQATLALVTGNAQSSVSDERPLRASAKLPLRASRRAFVFGGGAALAAGLIAAIVLRPERSIATAVGETRQLPLGDGSTVMLDTDSVIAVNFSREERAVTLDQGQALFRVAANARSPFVVRAGRVSVTATGTVFSVLRLTGSVEVTVTEGSVIVAANGQSIALTAGSRGQFGITARVVQMTEAEQSRSNAWTEGFLEFDGETLGEAVDRFNRYTRQRLIVIDPDLRNERIYGAFRVDDAAGFARAVALSLNATARPNADGVVIAPQRKKSELN